MLDHIMVLIIRIMSRRRSVRCSHLQHSNDYLPKSYHDDPAVKASSAKVGDVIRTFATVTLPQSRRVSTCNQATKNKAGLIVF